MTGGSRCTASPPCPGRRGLGDAPAAEHPLDRPRLARHAGAVEDRPGEPPRRRRRAGQRSRSPDVPWQASRPRSAISAEAAGLPGALKDAEQIGAQRDIGPRAVRAPDDLQPADHRGPPVRRPGLAHGTTAGVGKASGTTRNDVVLAMCSGAMRTYLLEVDACPTRRWSRWSRSASRRRSRTSPSASGGNAVSAVMVKLGTDLADPAERLQAVHDSMADGKRALAEMTPMQILAVSALGQAPAILGPMLRLSGLVEAAVQPDHQQRAGARTTAVLQRHAAGRAPTRCRSRSTAWRSTSPATPTPTRWPSGHRLPRTVPHLQRLLLHLDAELDRPGAEPPGVA